MKYIILPLIFLVGSMASAQSLPNSNEALADLSYMFFDNPKAPTFGSEYLDSAKLDFSIESLKHVDQYLDMIRVRTGMDTAWNIVILRAGAYVGEVIRRNRSNKNLIWLSYEQAKQKNSKLFESLGYNIATAAVLNDGGAGFVFPLGKVAKYLTNGEEDDLFFFAQMIIANDK